MALAASLAFSSACASGAYGPSGDARLDSAVGEALGEGKSAASVEELTKKRCSNYTDRLAKALNEDLEDAERLAAYTDLYKDFKGRLDAIDLALKQNPDLAYASSGDGESKPVGVKLDDLYKECIDVVANINEEFYKYLRELTEMPTVTDVKGNKRARMNLAQLKESIGILDPSDKEELLEKVRTAESQVAASGADEEEEEDPKTGKRTKKKKGR